LPVRSASMDFAYSVNCIEHVPDLDGTFSEAARVLKIGGQLFTSTEPLYFSARGHHFTDFFPIPWGHLLWSAEDLVSLILREGDEGRDWEPNVPLNRQHLMDMFSILNFAKPEDIRRALVCGPWRVRAWSDIIYPQDVALAKEIGLREALHGIPTEALLMFGLRFRLERRPRAEGLRLALRMDALKRRYVKSLRSLFGR